MRVESSSDKLDSCHTPARCKSYRNTIHPEPFVSKHSGYTFYSWNLLPAFPQTYFFTKNQILHEIMHATYTQKLIQNFLPWPKKDYPQTRFAQTWQLPQLPQLPHYLVCNNDFCFTKWPSIQKMFPLLVSLDEVMLSYYARACGALVKVTEVYAQSTSVPFSVSHIRQDQSI